MGACCPPQSVRCAAAWHLHAAAVCVTQRKPVHTDSKGFHLVTSGVLIELVVDTLVADSHFVCTCVVSQQTLLAELFM